MADRTRLVWPFAWLFTIVLGACGGIDYGGSYTMDLGFDIPNTEVSFPTPIYDVVVPQGGGAPVVLTATVWVQSALVGLCTLSMDPHGAAANPTAGDGPWNITPNSSALEESSGVAQVPLTISPLGGPGSYPLGSFTFTATIDCKSAGKAEATMILTVRQQPAASAAP
jgi:hypothetical protein